MHVGAAFNPGVIEITPSSLALHGPNISAKRAKNGTDTPAKNINT